MSEVNGPTGNSDEIQSGQPDRRESDISISIDSSSLTAKGDINVIGSIDTFVERGQTAIEAAREKQTFEAEKLAQGVTAFAKRLRAIAADNSDADKGEPYKGLLAYGLSDAELFFGRDQAIAELLLHLQRGRLTILQAESGAGKTSLLQAGISAQLIAAGHLPVNIRPYNIPPSLKIKQVFLPNLADTPGLAEAPLREFLRQVTAILGQSVTLYLLLDQFEEFFTLLPKETDQKTFVSDLADCLEDETLKVRWVLALRSEFFGDLANFRPRIKTPFDNDYRLNRLNLADAKTVITEPAARHGIGFEPTLVEQLLADLGGQDHVVAPPQIQLVCSALYHVLMERKMTASDLPLTITHQMYEEEGRAKGILRGHLNRVLRRTLPTEPERELARQLLIALVSADQRRIRRTRNDLAATLANYIVTTQSLDDLLTQLVENRLLNVEKDEETNEAGYELAHDYLLDEIEIDPEVQAQKAAQELLAQEVEAFKRFKTLLSKDKYDIINSQQEFLVLDKTAEELLRQSRDALEQAAREREALRQRELETAQKLAKEAEARAAEQIRATKRLRWLVISLTGGLLIVVVAIFFAILQAQQSQLATARRLVTESQEAVNKNDFRLATLLALEAQEQNQVEGTEMLGRIPFEMSTLTRPIEVLGGHSDDIVNIAWHPDGDRLASASVDGTITIWDVTNGQPLTTLTGHTSRVTCVAWHPGGNLLASGSWDGTVIIWDVNSNQQLDTMTGHSEEIKNIVWHPEGHRLASVSNDGTIVWDVDSGQEFTIPDAYLLNLFDVQAWHPGGKFPTSVWDVGDGQQLVALAGLTHHSLGSDSVAFHPDGNHLARGESDGKITVTELGNTKVYTIQNVKWIDRGRGADAAHQNVAWHPGGHLLASASLRDETVVIWDWMGDSAQPLATLTGHDAGVSKSIAWHPEGHLLAVASGKRVVIWEIDRNPPVTTITEDGNPVTSIAWQPEGDRLALGYKDGSVTVWDTVSGQQPAPYAQRASEITSLAWQANGDRLEATTKYDIPNNLARQPGSDRVASWFSGVNEIYIWDAGRGSSLSITSTGRIRHVAWHPKDDRLASAISDGTIIIWDVANDQQLTTFSSDRQFTLFSSGSISTLAWHPKGERLALVRGDTITIWDVDNGQQLAALTSHLQTVNSIAWHPEGDRLASASEDGTVIIWDTERSQPLTTLTGYPAGVTSVAWSPAGNRLASSSGDTVYIVPELFAKPACRWQSLNLNVREWKRYRGMAIYQPACDHLIKAEIPSPLDLYKSAGNLKNLFFDGEIEVLARYPETIYEVYDEDTWDTWSGAKLGLIDYFISTLPGRFLLVLCAMLILAVIGLGLYGSYKLARWSYSIVFRRRRNPRASMGE